MPDGYYPQVKPLDIGEVVRTGSAIQSRNVLNRLNQMKLQDAERKIAKAEGMNVLARQFSTPAQQGPPGGAPLQPASYDQQGYANALMQQYPQEGMKAQETLADREQKEFQRVVDLMNKDPEMGTRVFNQGPFGTKYGQIKYKGKKGKLHIIEDKKGGIHSVDTVSGEYKEIKAPRKGETTAERTIGLAERKFEHEKTKGPKKAYTEATARKRISGIQTAIARIRGGDKMDVLFASMPELRGILGSGDSSGAELSREAAIKALEDERVYVETFLPKEIEEPVPGRSLSQDMGGKVQPPTQGRRITREQAVQELKRRRGETQ